MRSKASQCQPWIAALAIASGTWLGACGSPSSTSSDAMLEDSDNDDGDISVAKWLDIADVGGGPVQEIAVAALDGKIYAVGGFNDSLQVVDSVQVYDPTTDAWSFAAPLPGPMHHVNLVAFDSKLLLLGGMTGLNFQAVGDTYVYDPSKDSWTPLAPMPAGQERGAAALGVVDDKIVLAGGLRSGGAVAVALRYDPASDSWSTEVPSLPEARDHLMGASINGELIVVGGRRGGIASIESNTWRFDGSSWTEGAVIPTARAGAAAAVVQGRLVVVGGEGNPESDSGVFADSEQYDPQSDSWQTLPNMSTPRHGMGAAAVGNALYVPGGATTQGFGADASAQVLEF